jgi:3-hydroxyisobutyrate dehydrogenase-like beta-hydroxyacid dehydrogenase
MSGDKNVKVGFIGLGVMGAAMAANLQKKGFQLVVNDARREACESHLAAGAEWADTAKEVAEKSDVVFTCLPTVSIIEKVALGPNGLIEGIKPGQAYFEMSTNSLDVIKKLHAAFAERGAHMLEAPISGGGGGARRGRLAIWVGGDKESYDRYEHVLRAIGDKPTHVGPIGSGLVTKLVHNCSSQATQAAIAEIFSFGVKAGADPLSLWKAIRQGSIGRRRTFDGLATHFLAGDFDNKPEAALRIIHKDMYLATGLAREIGVPLRIANLAFADIQEAMLRGWEERDARSVMQLPQERAGVNIKVDRSEIDQVLRDDPAAPTDTRYGKDE